MKTIGKKMLAMLLCIVMCVSLLPISVLAEEGTIANEQRGTIVLTAEEENTETAVDTVEEESFSVSDVIITDETEKMESFSAEGEEDPVASNTCGDDLTWKLDENGVLTISGTGNMWDVGYDSVSPWDSYKDSITSVVIENGAESIGMYAFKDCVSLKNVTIPESVAAIGMFAFQSCTSLQDVKIPANVTNLSATAFRECTSFTGFMVDAGNTSYTAVDGVLFSKDKTTLICYPAGKTDSSYNITDGVTTIGQYALTWCDTLTSVSIPDSVTSIKDYAFGWCPALTNIAIGNGVTSIGGLSFAGCTSLTSITIPCSVTSIGFAAFADCTSLTEVVFEGNAPTFGTSAFSSVTATVYYPADDETWTEDIMQDYGGSITWESSAPEIVVASGTCGENLTWTLTDDGVLMISGTGEMEDYTPFGSTPWDSYCQDIKTAVVEDGVTAVGAYAFKNCTALTEVQFGKDVTSIRAGAFRECSAITSITIPDGVESIGAGIFFKCGALETVVLPNSLTSIGEAAFNQCTALHSLVIPDGVTTIGGIAFFMCTSLVSVEIPTSVVLIGDNPFESCPALTDIIVSGDNANYMTVDGVLFNKELTTLITYPAAKVGSTYSIPDSVTTIGECAFNGATSLTNITIPNSVTEICRAAFAGCKVLAAMELPDGLETIGGSAFSGCIALTDIAIPNKITNIGQYVFSQCTSLTSVTIPVSVKTIETGAFQNCFALTDIYYAGTEEEWGEISINSSLNPILETVTVHYKGDDEFSPEPNENGEIFFTTFEQLKIIAGITSEETRYAIYQGTEPLVIEEEFTLPEGLVLAVTWQREEAPRTIEVPNGITLTVDGKIGKGEGSEILSILGTVVVDKTPFNADTALNIGPLRVEGTLQLTGEAIVSGEVSGTNNIEFVDEGDTLSQLTIVKNASVLEMDVVKAHMDLAENMQEPGSHFLFRAQIQNTLEDDFALDEISMIPGNAELRLNGMTYMISEDAMLDNEGSIQLSGTSLRVDGSLANNGNITISPYCSLEVTGEYSGSGTLTVKCFAEDAPENHISGIDLSNFDKELSESSFVDTYVFTPADDNYLIVEPDGETNVIVRRGETATLKVKVTASEDAELHYSWYRFTTWDEEGKIGGTWFDNDSDTLVTEPVNGNSRYECYVYDQYDNDGSVAFTVDFERPEGYCGDNVTWNLENGVLTLSGSGDMWDYFTENGFAPPWYTERANITKVIVEEGITGIGNYAFAECSNLTEAVLPEGITYLHSDVFANTTSLKTIDLPSTITTIGRYAFYGSGLTTLKLPESLTEIGQAAFMGCAELEEIFVESKLEKIGYAAFCGCSKLDRIKVTCTVEDFWKQLEKMDVLDENEPFLIADPIHVHTPGGPVCENEVAATCTEEGSYDEVVTCTVCGEEISRETITTERVAHTPGEPIREHVVPATTTADGSYDEVIRCTVCDEILSSVPKTIPMLTYKLSETELTVVAGKTGTLNVTDDKGKTVSAVWSTSNDEIAAVNKGVVTARKAGKAVITATVGDFSAECEIFVQFTDVTDSSRSFYEPVYWALENGITTGTSAKTFSPSNSCTRAQIVTFLWRLKDCPEPSSMESPFTDVTNPKASYYKPVLWALENGITTGTSKTTFSPTKPCTRAQCVTFLWRALGCPEPSSTKSPFKDVTNPNASFYKAVLWALENGITTGTSKTTFSPNNTCTRGQIVTFLYRYNNLSPVGEGGLVGVAMPTNKLQRWNQDGENMKSMLEAAGYSVDLQFADNDIVTQVSQIQNMINKGCKVLIVAPIDSDSLATVLAKAKSTGISVISYDRLIMNSDAVTCYVSFSNWAVGVKQGEFIRDALDLDNAQGSFNIEFITGDPGDSNVNFFFGGAMSVLQPYLDSGKLVCPSGQTAKEDVATQWWSTNFAYDRFENIIANFYSDGTPLHAVLASNDSTALGVENALASFYNNDVYPIITGQDCDIAIMKNLIEGKQAMSIFKDVRDLAVKAVEMADALMKGDEPPINDTETFDNGTGIIPSYLCDPVVCTAENYKELLIDSGFYTEEMINN